MLKEAVETAYLHYHRALDNFNELKELTLDQQVFDNKEIIKTIDAFIFRFIKLQDFMGDKLFKTFLNRIGEYKDTMSLLDVMDKLEKLEIITDADRWMEFRQLRNKLTHEYPDNQEDVISGIKLALEQFKEIGIILDNINRYSQLPRIKERSKTM